MKTLLAKDAEFIIEAMQEAIFWAEYAPDYYKEKHNLKQDQENVEKAIEILKAKCKPKSCSTCKYLLRSYCELLDIEIMTIVNQSCTGHEERED
jgi:hypothetical protein